MTWVWEREKLEIKLNHDTWIKVKWVNSRVLLDQFGKLTKMSVTLKIELKINNYFQVLLDYGLAVLQDLIIALHAKLSF